MAGGQVEVVGLRRVRDRVAAATANVAAAPRRMARDLGALVRDALKEEAPGRGNLRDSIAFRVSQVGESAEVRFRGAWWSHFVTRGTRPHAIWAGFYTGKSDKRFLFFGGGGVAHVQHPGARSDDYVSRAYGRSRPGIAAALAAAGRAILGR